MKYGFSMMWKKRIFQKWNDRLAIIKKLRKLRKKQGIRVRLLMTSGCIEYWFMLHYKYYTRKSLLFLKRKGLLAK